MTLNRFAFLCLAAVSLFSSMLPGCTPNGGTTTTPNGGESRLTLSTTEPFTLDPAKVGDAGAATFITQVFNGLVKISHEGVLPDITESWAISPDGKTYTFKLRRDVKFHDGKQVTAADFKYSFERALSPVTGSTTARTYLGDILGAEEMLSGKASSLAGVRIIDDFTLAITIDKPRSYFLSKLTYATGSVVDRTNVEAAGSQWWRTPNGTGPFKLVEWNAGSSIKLTKNAQFYGGAPHLDSVIFRFLAGRPMDLYETGQIDVADVDLAYLDRVLDPAGSFAAEAQMLSQLSFFFIGFNCSAAPFDDPLIRQAFSIALDRSKLVKLVFNDAPQAAEGIVPPGIPGYNPAVAGLDFNLAKAKSLIAQSKYGSAANLPPITLTTLGYGGLIAVELEAIVYEWRVNLGVDVKVRQLEPERFLYNLKQEKDQLYYQGWIADYPHQQNFLEVLFKSSADNNWGEYSSLQVDKLLDEAASLTDTVTSQAKYRQVEQLLVSDAAVWPFYFGRSHILVKPYVKGYELNPLGVPILANVIVERQVISGPISLTVG